MDSESGRNLCESEAKGISDYGSLDPCSVIVGATLESDTMSDTLLAREKDNEGLCGVDNAAMDDSEPGTSSTGDSRIMNGHHVGKNGSQFNCDTSINDNGTTDKNNPQPGTAVSNVNGGVVNKDIAQISATTSSNDGKLAQTVLSDHTANSGAACDPKQANTDAGTVQQSNKHSNKQSHANLHEKESDQQYNIGDIEEGLAEHSKTPNSLDTDQTVSSNDSPTSGLSTSVDKTVPSSHQGEITLTHTVVTIESTASQSGSLPVEDSSPTPTNPFAFLAQGGPITPKSPRSPRSLSSEAIHGLGMTPQHGDRSLSPTNPLAMLVQGGGPITSRSPLSVSSEAIHGLGLVPNSEATQDTSATNPFAVLVQGCGGPVTPRSPLSLSTEAIHGLGMAQDDAPVARENRPPSPFATLVQACDGPVTSRSPLSLSAEAIHGLGMTQDDTPVAREERPPSPFASLVQACDGPVTSRSPLSLSAEAIHGLGMAQDDPQLPREDRSPSPFAMLVQDGPVSRRSPLSVSSEAIHGLGLAPESPPPSQQRSPSLTNSLSVLAQGGPASPRSPMSLSREAIQGLGMTTPSSPPSSRQSPSPPDTENPGATEKPPLDSPCIVEMKVIQKIDSPHGGHLPAERCDSFLSTMSEKTDICRICHCEGDENNSLISPCLCSGSLKYIHLSCLQKWIKSSEKKACELCNFEYSMTTKTKPFKQWERLEMSSSERRKVVCSVTFHLIALTCVIWSLYVLIERTTAEVSSGALDWPFWTKLIVVAIGFTGGVVFMYVQCKMYFQLCIRWRAYNKLITVENAPEDPEIRAEAAARIKAKTGEQLQLQMQQQQQQLQQQEQEQQQQQQQGMVEVVAAADIDMNDVDNGDGDGDANNAGGGAYNDNNGGGSGGSGGGAGDDCSGGHVNLVVVQQDVDRF